LNTLVLLIIAAAILATVIALVMRKMPRGPRIPEALRAGRPLPDIEAVDEDGNRVSSSDLLGAPAVVLFVRGNWCPFCSKQVEKLTAHYKEITDLGARLVLITPKPLSTTRRVARFFEVEFEFWLDNDLRIARSLGLLYPHGVPRDSFEEYGEDTVWPTALVVDAGGIIRYSKLSRYLFDRPNPELLVRELRKTGVSASAAA